MLNGSRLFWLGSRHRHSLHVQVPKAVPPPPVLLRLTASLPKAGISLQLGPAGSKVERLEVLLSGASFSLAEDNEVRVLTKLQISWVFHHCSRRHCRAAKRQCSAVAHL